MPLPDGPEIVCLCGSARFAEQMYAQHRDLSLAGVIVLMPVLPPPDSGVEPEPLTDEQKTVLGALHLHKIELADRMLVVNPGGYLGESTTREIAHARAAGKPVDFTDPGSTPATG